MNFGSADVRRGVVEHARTFLFVPGTRKDRYDKAVAHARAGGWLAAGGKAVEPINGLGTPWSSADVDGARQATRIVLPKTEDGAELSRIT